MGEIVYKTLIRFAVSISVSMVLKITLMKSVSGFLVSLGIYLFTIYPHIRHTKFIEENKTIINKSLCSTCKHFDESAVLCIKYDKHPTENFIPCEEVVGNQNRGNNFLL